MSVSATDNEQQQSPVVELLGASPKSAAHSHHTAMRLCETTEAQALSSGSTSELDLMTAMSGHVLHRIKLQQTCQLVDSPALLTVSMAVMAPVLLSGDNGRHIRHNQRAQKVAAADYCSTCWPVSMESECSALHRHARSWRTRPDAHAFIVFLAWDRCEWCVCV